MRFTAVLGDSKSVEIFSKVLGIASKICRKRIVVRITPNEFSFVNVYSIREGICLDFRLLKDQLFCSWVFEGISVENNAIFFELSTDDLIGSIQSRENQAKFKLVKKDNIPHLRIELSANGLVNEIPINFILVRNWNDYNPPNMGTPSVAVTLPPVKNLSKILSAVKNIGAKNAVSVCAITDMAKVDIYAGDLTNLSLTGSSTTTPATPRRSIDEFSSAILDIRALYPFVSKIVNGKGAIFSATELECHLTLYIAGQQQD
uniref:Checkpoint protein n=1 Tax=Meloidogyne javanica TaxID=6303 RepID=A0A915M850_MELJA